jgi:hypothetical protein
VVRAEGLLARRGLQFSQLTGEEEKTMWWYEMAESQLEGRRKLEGSRHSERT